MKGTKRTGRPAKTAQAGQRVSLGLKVTAEIKNRLDEAAGKNGRTQSQEAELRLERSFDRDDLLAEILNMRYGPDFAPVIYLIAEAMAGAGSFASAVNENDPRDWLNDAFSFNEAALAAHAIIEWLRPPGSPDGRRGGHWRIGKEEASQLIEGIATGRPVIAGKRSAEIVERARAMLGNEAIAKLTTKRIESKP